MTQHKYFGAKWGWSAAVLIGLLLGFGCSSGSDAFTGTSDSRSSDTNSRSTYRLVAAQTPALTNPKRKTELSLLASGSENARIVDQDREVVRSAPPGGTIFSLQVSPKGEYVLLSFGSSKYAVVTATALEDLTSPPKRPPSHDDATGFSWRFLDDDHLLGLASLPSTDTRGKTMAEIEGLSPRAVLPYIYAWKTGQLMPVEIDESLPAIFFIYDASGWNVTLLTYDDDLVGARIIRSPAAGVTNPP